MNANRYRLLPADHRPVERVSGPHLVRPGALEPAQGPLLLLRPRGRPVQLQPLEQPLQRPVRRRPPGRDLQDPPDLRRGPPGFSRFSASASASTSAGSAARLPRRRHQRVEPALLVPPAPPGQRRVRHRDPPAARPLVDTARQLPGPPAPLRRLSSGSRSSCTSEYRNRPVSRARSTRLLDPPHPKSSHRVLSRLPARRPVESDRHYATGAEGNPRRTVTPGQTAAHPRERGRRRRPGTEATPS